MSLADLAVTAATGAGGGGVAVAIINALFSRGGERAKAAQVDSATFRSEFHDVFEKVERQCADCERLLNRFRNAFYDLLDDLNGLDGVDVATLRAQVRAAARRARAAADWEAKP